MFCYPLLCFVIHYYDLLSPIFFLSPYHLFNITGGMFFTTCYVFISHTLFFISYYVLLSYTMFCYPYYVLLLPIMFCYLLECFVSPYYVLLHCFPLLCFVISYNVLFPPIMFFLYHTMFCYPLLCSVTLYYVLLSPITESRQILWHGVWVWWRVNGSRVP